MLTSYLLRPRRGLCVALLAVFVATAAAAPVAATTYNIATFSDAAIDDGNCTLREALRAADGNVAVDACPAGTAADNIVLPTGTYDFHGQEVLSGAGSLKITSADLNPFHVTIDLHSEGRFLALSGGGTFVIGGIAIVNGLAYPGYGQGGAILAENVDLEVTSFRFVSNVASEAGGALFYGAYLAGGVVRLAMSHGTFLANQVTNPSPSTFGSGGGLYVTVMDGNDADLRDVAFLSNSVTDDGLGAVGGAISFGAADAGSTATCVRCSFDGNSIVESVAGSLAIGGGAYLVANNGGAVDVTDGRFTHNHAHHTAGGTETAALYASASAASIHLERLFIDDNTGPATNGTETHDVVLGGFSGSGISLLDSALTFGGANGLRAYVDGAFMVLGHLTIADYPGTGAWFQIIGGTSSATLDNSILSLNAPGHDLEVAGTLYQSANLVGVDPPFVDEPGGNYRVAPPSSAIDTGSRAVLDLRSLDLDHHARIAGPGPDRGAYEYAGLFGDDLEVGDLGAWSGRTPAP